VQRVLRRNRVASGAILGIVSTAILFQQITSAMCALCLLHQLGIPVGSCCQAERANISKGEVPFPSAQGSCCNSGSSKPFAEHPASCCSGHSEESSSGSRCACIKDGATRAVASPSIVLPTSVDETVPFVNLATDYASPSILVSLRITRNLDLPPPSCPRFVRFHCLLI
jgi:hypothetical protein